MKFPPYEKQYRILEVRKKGTTTFFPQEQIFYFFWQSIVQKGYEYLKEEFDTMQEAEEFLFNFQRTRSKREIDEKEEQEKAKLDKETTHPFNAVFYRLKQKEK